MRKAFLGLAIAFSAFTGVALAQPYPSRPVTLIVPFGAGGPVDTLARSMSEAMRAALGQPVLIKNVTGASGTIGVGRAVRAPPRRLHRKHRKLALAYRQPKGTPQQVIRKLTAAAMDALADPAVRARLAGLGQEIPPREQQTAQGLAAHQKAEIEKWWPLIKAANIKAE